MKVFNTGEVASICKVARSTVGEWFNSGKLKGSRIPGSQERRIPQEDLERFLKEHGMIAALTTLQAMVADKILLVSQDQNLKVKVDELCNQNRHHDLRLYFADSQLSANDQFKEHQPGLVIIDFGPGIPYGGSYFLLSSALDSICIALLPADYCTRDLDIRASEVRLKRKPITDDYLRNSITSIFINK